MTLIVCVDDRMGMMFNHRRQSRDREVIRRVLALAQGRTLRTSLYSAPLFDGEATADDNYAANAAPDDVCFAEDGDLPLDRADRLILYHWHRQYPADRRFPADPVTLGFVSVTREDFVGSSHDCITEEVFMRHDSL